MINTVIGCNIFLVFFKMDRLFAILESFPIPELKTPKIVNSRPKFCKDEAIHEA